PNPARVARFADGMVLRIERLRIEAVPPKSLAVRFRQPSVISQAGERTAFVGVPRRLVPGPGMRRVFAHAEAESVSAGRFGPACDEILLRPDARGVPRLILAVPVVEVVVMIGERDEVLRAGALVERHEFVRVP